MIIEHKKHRWYISEKSKPTVFTVDHKHRVSRNQHRTISYTIITMNILKLFSQQVNRFQEVSRSVSRNQYTITFHWKHYNNNDIQILLEHIPSVQRTKWIHKPTHTHTHHPLNRTHTGHECSRTHSVIIMKLLLTKLLK